MSNTARRALTTSQICKGPKGNAFTRKLDQQVHTVYESAMLWLWIKRELGITDEVANLPKSSPQPDG